MLLPAEVRTNGNADDTRRPAGLASAYGREIPLPDWSVFDDEDLLDLSDTLRSDFRHRAIPEPAGVANDSRTSRTGAANAAFTRELSLIRDYEFIDLPTGHWPQFTRPAELAEAILVAVAPR